MSQVLDFAWYRFRATLRSRRTGYLSVTLLIGLIGGVAMASVATARRTQSSYPTFLASTNPSDLGVTVYGPDGGPVAHVKGAIERIPGVRRVRDVAFLVNLIPLSADGAPRPPVGPVQVLPVGSLDGEFIDQDRPGMARGHMVGPARPNEAVMSASVAAAYGFHVGQVVPVGLFTNEQEAMPGGQVAVQQRLAPRAGPRRVARPALDEQV